MFSLPPGSGGEVPLVLEGIQKDDFRAFLTVLSSLHYESVTAEGSKAKTIFIVARSVAASPAFLQLPIGLPLVV